MLTYWWTVQPNLGDGLTPLVLRALGIEPVWASAATARLFAIGSIAHRVPEDFDGAIWGSGAMAGPVRLSRARVLALRGPLTGVAPLYADPGLLSSLLAPPRTAEHPVGHVRHYVDHRPPVGHAIDVTADPREVIAAIARCERIVSSSLHGIIVADALGIPSRWDPHPAVRGDGFKFRDYAASYRRDRVVPGIWRLADQAEVADKRDALVAAARLLEPVAA